MKRLKWKMKWAPILVIASLAVSTGCGKSDPAANPGTPGAVPVAPIGTPLTPVPTTCVPINAQIPFTATNIYFSSVNIVGGAVPGETQAYGQVMIGGSPTGGPYQRTGVDGTVSINIMPSQQANVPTPPVGIMPYNGYGTQSNLQPPSLANANGFVAISAQTQADIMWQFGGGGTQYPNYNTGYLPQPTLPVNQAQQVCISGIALSLGHYYNTIYGGHVFLYLNNSQSGYKLYF
ncbi:hypothetical protein WDW37_21710 [Bdellovibrionota bacterium FG-1]